MEAAGRALRVPSEATPLPALRDDIGGFDVVIEAAGRRAADARHARRSCAAAAWPACSAWTGGRSASAIDGPVVGVDSVLGNRALLGSVNAHRTDWEAAVAALDAARARWPEALERFVGLRVPLDRFADAFAFRGVKATLTVTP